MSEDTGSGGVPPEQQRPQPQSGGSESRPHESRPHEFGPHEFGPHASTPPPGGPYAGGPPASGPYAGTPPPGGPPGGGPYQSGPDQQGPYQQGPYQQGPYQQGPYQQGPYQQGPYQQGPYQQGPYQAAGYPGGYQTGPVPTGYPPPPGPGGQPDYLGAGYAPPAPAPRRRRGRMLWVITAAATALVLGAGGVTAYTLLSGSSVALDSQVPADAAAFAEINLDPPAGQKVAALRFFRHLPDLNVREDAPTLIEGLLEPLFDSPEDRRRFAEHIKPWLGKHAAVAADPQGPRTEPVVLVETTDAAKTRAGLDALAREERAKYGYVIVDRTVVLARTQAVAQAAADDASRGSLHDNETFRQDIDLVGDDGVLTAWMDLARAESLNTGSDSGTRSSDAPRPDLSGRVVAGLRFTDTAADLTIRGVGLGQTGVGSEAVGPRLATLPDDTAAALAVSGADQAVRQVYDQATKAGFGETLRSLEERTRLVLPDDVAALVGSSTVVAVGGTEGNVDYGLISRTDDVDKARSAAERLLSELGEDSTIAVRSVPTGTVLASSTGYADKLAAPGTLGDSELFRNTLPDLDGAQVALYVDIRRVAQLDGETPSGPAAGIRSVGFTAGATADTATVRLRMVVG